MSERFRGIWLIVGLAGLSGCSEAPRAKPTLTVSAAADLTNVFREIGEAFEREQGVHVDFNFGSSGGLARQIEQGADVDVYAAANVAFIDDLASKKLILPGTKALYGRGRLVCWQRDDAPLKIIELTDLTKPEIRHISIANPVTAPYGIAAKQTLESLQLWDQLQVKIVGGENIRQAFQYVETGNADAGLIALPLCRPGVGHWRLVPEDLHKPLDQALAVIASSKHPEEATAFAKYVTSPAGRTILRRYGLTLPGETLPPELTGESPARTTEGP